MTSSIRIFHKNGTYFKQWTRIGPMFGATRDEAAVFKTRLEAAREMRHYSFASCKIEVDDGKTVEVDDE